MLKTTFAIMFQSDAKYTNILLFLFLLIIKIMFTLNLESFGWDGSYYYNVAKNIQNGLGFTTNLSLYHQGMTYFPHPTPVYPLWPALLGYTSHIFPLKLVAYILPVLLYWGTMIIAYRLIQKNLPENIVNTKYCVLNYAHLGVFILCLHGKYFEATSRPYTEALAYFLLFICLTRLTSILSLVRPATFLEIGIWSAILLLVRSQFIIFLISVVFFYFVLLLWSRNMKYLWGICMLTLSFLVVYAPQLFFLSERLGQVNQGTLFFFDQYQASDALSRLNVLVKYENFFQFLYYKLYGFGVAFFPWGKYSYSAAFHGFQYSFILMLFTIPVVCFSSKNRKILCDRTQDLLSWPEKRFLLFLIIFALASFLSIHMLHKTLWAFWNFSTRHALLCSFIFFLAFLFLLRQSLYPKLKKTALFIFLAATLIGVGSLIFQTIHQTSFPKYSEKKVDLIYWFKSELSKKPSLSIAMPNPQKISVYSEGVNFHWIYYNTSKKDFKTLFSELGVDYLLLPQNEYTKLVKKIKNFSQLFTKQKKMLSGFFVLSPTKKLLNANDSD